MNQIKKALLTPAELEQISKRILADASQHGASAAEVSISTNKGFTVTAHDGDVETVEYNQDKIVEINVYFGQRRGSVSISDLRAEATQAAVQAACHIAKFTDADPASGLAEKEELAFHYPQLDLTFPWDISVEKAIALAIQCEQEARAYDSRIMSAEASTISTVEGLHLYANTNGFSGFFPFTKHDIGCVLVAKQNDEMQRDYSYSVATDPKQLTSISTVAKQAAERTVNRLGARRLRTCKAPVIYLAEEARGLLGHLASAITGGKIYRKASFLVDHLDKQIFPSFISLQEHPHLACALGSAPFDNEGVVTRSNVFIEKGVLRSYALGSYSARKLGMKTTGNSGGMHNLTITTGNKTLAELLKTMDKGLLVTEMMGNGVNLVTGDYSRGVGGFWVEKGEIQFPVQEITIAGKLQEMYKGIREVGSDVDLRGNIRTGSILIEEMMIAGE